MALITDQIGKRGNHYYLGDERIAHGRDGALKALEERPDLCQAIYKAAMEGAGITTAAAASPTPPSSEATSGRPAVRARAAS
jgi:hypothetical protein